MNAAELAGRFEAEFRAQPEVFRAPGRVNLIGEHTDYNDGFVLPSAIGFYTRVAAGTRPDRKLAIRSTKFAESYEFELISLPQDRLATWCDYVLGVAIMLVGLMLWTGVGKGWIGRLPGDIRYSKGNFSFHFPIVTCLLISAFLTILLWLFRK